MPILELKANTRDKDTSLTDLRKNRRVPAVLYGHNIKNQSIDVAVSEFVKVYKQAGESTLLDLVIGDTKPVKVLVHAIARNVETNTPEHIDFYQVNMAEKLHADIPIIFEGDSPAVKAQGGTLITQTSSIPVKCLPEDLVDAFKVDIGVLDDFSKRIHISDIKNIPETMEVLKPMDQAVALVAPPRVVEVDTPVVSETEEGEDAETEEGEAPAEGESPSVEEAAKEPAKTEA